MVATTAAVIAAWGASGYANRGAAVGTAAAAVMAAATTPAGVTDTGQQPDQAKSHQK